MFELPECFEAEERSVPDTADVLQLVSGRTLLGVVREQQLQYLAGGCRHILSVHLQAMHGRTLLWQLSSLLPS